MGADRTGKKKRASARTGEAEHAVAEAREAEAREPEPRKPEPREPEPREPEPREPEPLKADGAPAMRAAEAPGRDEADAVVDRRASADEGPSIGALLAKAISELDRALAETLPRVRGGKDADAIHDMRVAIRKLRTILRFARPVYGRFHADAVRRAFADLQRATGELRDEEVLEETLDGCAPGDAAFQTFLTARKAREAALRRAALRLLEDGTIVRARRLLEALVLLPVAPKRDGSAAAFAARCVARAEKAVRAHSDVEPQDVAGLHELRIQYKQLRYALEIFAEVLPAESAARAKVAASYQKRLGEIHDIDVALHVTGEADLPEATKARVHKTLSERRDEALGRFLVLRVHEAEREAERPPV